VLDSNYSATHKRQTHYALKYFCVKKGGEFEYKPPKSTLEEERTYGRKTYLITW